MTGSNELERFAERVNALSGTAAPGYFLRGEEGRRIVLALVAEVRAARHTMGEKPIFGKWREAWNETDAALREQSRT